MYETQRFNIPRILEKALITGGARNAKSPAVTQNAVNPTDLQEHEKSNA